MVLVSPTLQPSRTQSLADLSNEDLDSTVISIFAVLILSVIALLYRSKHEAFMGTTGDPELEQAGAIAGTIFTAVFVYLVS